MCLGKTKYMEVRLYRDCYRTQFCHILASCSSKYYLCTSKSCFRVNNSIYIFLLLFTIISSLHYLLKFFIPFIFIIIWSLILYVFIIALSGCWFMRISCLLVSLLVTDCWLEKTVLLKRFPTFASRDIRQHFLKLSAR